MGSMDKDFCELFFKVMKTHLTDFLSNEKIKRVKKALPEIRRKYKGERVKKTSLVHSFPTEKCDSTNKQNVAYFYECSTCLASSTAQTFVEIINDNSDFFQRKMQRKTVNICCIAGGIASEMVAVVKILSQHMKNSMHEYLNFKLTFINNNNNWNSIINSVIIELENNLKESHKIKLNPRFVPVQTQQDVLDVFHSADILISSKFSQEMSDMTVKTFKQLFEVAFEHMKSDSFIFFIDTSGADSVHFLEEKISQFSYFQSIYRKSCDYHGLSMESIKHHVARYGDYFGVDLNSSYCFFSACAYLKLEKRKNSKTEETTVATIATPHRNQTKKEKKDARKSAYWLRRSVDIQFSHAG